MTKLRVYHITSVSRASHYALPFHIDLNWTKVKLSATLLDVFSSHDHYVFWYFISDFDILFLKCQTHTALMRIQNYIATFEEQLSTEKNGQYILIFKKMLIYFFGVIQHYYSTEYIILLLLWL